MLSLLFVMPPRGFMAGQPATDKNKNTFRIKADHQARWRNLLWEGCSVVWFKPRLTAVSLCAVIWGKSQQNSRQNNCNGCIVKMWRVWVVGRVWSFQRSRLNSLKYSLCILYWWIWLIFIMQVWMAGLVNRFGYGWLEFHTELCFTLLFPHPNLPQTLWI